MLRAMISAHRMLAPMSAPTAATEIEPRGAWVVVWACFTALAVIFGVAYSFAALFEPLQQQFQATRADVSLLFGLSGLIYFCSAPAPGWRPTASARARSPAPAWCASPAGCWRPASRPR